MMHGADGAWGMGGWGMSSPLVWAGGIVLLIVVGWLLANATRRGGKTG